MPPIVVASAFLIRRMQRGGARDICTHVVWQLISVNPVFFCLKYIYISYVFFEVHYSCGKLQLSYFEENYGLLLLQASYKSTSNDGV